MNIEELLRILSNKKAEEVAKTKKEREATGLFPPPSILEKMQRMAIYKDDDALVLLAAVLKELRELRTIIDEMRKEKECESRK